jgi:hypothetical protein
MHTARWPAAEVDKGLRDDFAVVLPVGGAVGCGGGTGGAGGGGGNLGTSPGSYTVTVTGTSGNITQKATISHCAVTSSGKRSSLHSVECDVSGEERL